MLGAAEETVLSQSESILISGFFDFDQYFNQPKDLHVFPQIFQPISFPPSRGFWCPLDLDLAQTYRTKFDAGF